MKQLTKYHKKSFYTFMIFNILVPLTNIAFAYSIKIIIDSGMSQNREALTQPIYKIHLSYPSSYQKNHLQQ